MVTGQYSRLNGYSNWIAQRAATQMPVLPGNKTLGHTLLVKRPFWS